MSQIPLVILLLTVSIAGLSQEEKVSFTGVISFPELEKRMVSRQVAWTNPNGSAEQMTFAEMAIPVDQQMKDLTRDFMMANYHIDSIWVNPRMIVFHSMDLGNLRNSLEQSSFLNDQIPEAWATLYKAGKVPNGIHFIIEKNGNIVCLTPPVSRDGLRISYKKEDHKWMIRRHQDANPTAVGIENVTDQNGSFSDLTVEQIASNARLARWLMHMESGKINYLTSHDQFNEEKEFNKMLEVFSLRHYQRENRTVGRKDIGRDNLLKIIQRLDRFGFQIHSRFLP